MAILLKPCARPGCTAPIAPPPSRPLTDTPGKARRYCSHRCASIENARLRGHAFFVAIGAKAHRAKRQKGTHALRPHEERLMAAGRFFEAARMVYDRAYSAGWMAGRTGRRQLPAHRAYPEKVSA